MNHSATDPFSPRLQRLAASVGLGFVLLLIVSIIVGGGDTPDYDASAAEWVEYAADNESEVQVGGVLLSLAAFQFLWFVGYLRGEIGRAEAAARGFTRMSHIIFAGGVTAAVGFVLSAGLTTAAVSQPDGTPAEIVRSLGTLSYYPFLVASVGLATMLYTSWFAISKLGVLPRWLGIIGLIGGLAYLATLFVQLNPEDDGGAVAVAFPIGFLALLVFVGAASIIFMRSVGRPAPTAGP
jgi:hypothetical protein